MRVLLIEDEARLAEAVCRGLANDGSNVGVQLNGTDGLWAATEERCDVIILDIMLPGMNGYELVKHLRARRVWTPVLMLTAKDAEYDQLDVLQLGADDYLTKPFSYPVLLARLHALARQGAPGRLAISLPGVWRSIHECGVSPAAGPHWSDPARVRTSRVLHTQARRRGQQDQDPRCGLGRGLLR